MSHSNLVLSRRLGEQVVVKDFSSGNEVYITVVEINRGQIRLSIRAPKEVEVDRLEIFLRKNPPLKEVS